MPMELVELAPKLINWPEVRVTAYYQEGQQELLRDNLAAMGQQQPVVVIKVGDVYVGVDGLHRCQAALDRGDPTVPCVVREGDDKDALMSNLVLNSLRGRTKASEQVSVLGELFDNLKVSIEELEAKTGHSRAWVENMILVSRASPPVRDALDQELITLGHATALAEIKDPGIQDRVCRQLLMYRWTVKDLREHIKGVLEQRAEADAEPPKPEPTGPTMIVCAFCKHQVEVAMITSMPTCASCTGVLVDYIRGKEAEGGGPAPP